MELKSGYKKTEVGVIPEVWEVHAINQVFQFKQGVQSPVGEQAHVERQGYKRFIRIIDLTDPSVPWRFIADPGTVHHVSPKDLFMVRYGSPGLLGFGHEGVIANNLFQLIPRKKIVAEFYFQYLSSRRSDIADISGSSTMPAVNFSTLSRLKLIYPSPSEQGAIAEALSDVDELLRGLERLIAKKQNLKQAAMQQLLTAQIRLPGFHEEWQVKRLGDIADILKGSALSKTLTTSSGVRRCILYGELFTTYGRVISDVFGRTNSSEGCPSIYGDVLMPASTTTTGIDLATASALLLDEVALGGDIIIIRQKGSAYDSVFLANYLTQARRREIAELTQGITIHHLYGKDLKTVSLQIPDLPEQTAIAKVLTEMDAELAALEQRREKTRALKQAMMQELLTGRIRLVGKN